MSIKDISHFTNKATTLQRMINEPISDKQIFAIAQEAALAYQQISNNLLNSNQQNREELARLSKIFSSIESAAINRIQKVSNRPPLNTIL